MHQGYAATVTAFWALVGAAGDSRPPANVGPSSDTTLFLSGGSYLDVRAGALRPNGAIVVRGGRIVAVHAPGSTWRPATDARVLALDGRTILPGLIDAHVHLTLAGDPIANAAATLRAGFATVVDLGSAAAGGARLREAIARGQVPGPRIVAAGSWIGSKGGVCEFGGATVATAAAARARAQADLGAGADLLKVCVTGWAADAAAFPDSVELKPDLLNGVLETGRAAGRPVFAHAIGQAGALLAADGGIPALAHTPIVDSAGAHRLRARRTYVISTLVTLTAGPAGDRVRRSFRLLHEAGVPIVLGTDAGVLPHGRNAQELVALVQAGLSPLEALRAATLNAARLLDEGGVVAGGVGEIVEGAAGDFVVVLGDPLRDVRVLERPVLVVKAGRVVG
ncbi:MAG: amidohydrolase family protein [Gemmatimonadota bacterium]|nr:amidohydrolase family protein [Gemmatimonadota bacterium]